MGEGGKMNQQVRQDFNWQERFYPFVKKVLADNAIKIVCIEVAPPEQDMKQATDFIVHIKGGMVAVRIRRDVANNYRDLTIRSKRPSGVETELQKIKKGFADFYLYIWTSKDSIIDWWLVDINKMRIAGLFDAPRREIWNKDKSSAFIAIAINELQRVGALIAKMIYPPYQRQ
jgi:hypothetical protein